MQNKNNTISRSCEVIELSLGKGKPRGLNFVEFSVGTEAIIRRFLREIAKCLGVNRVGLALFDDRRAHYRITEGFDVVSPEREEVICERVFVDGHAIVCSDVLAVPDLSKYPIVEKEGVRFYVGLPLHSSKGSTIGVICSWDKIPLAVPSDEALGQIKALASLVSYALEGEAKTHEAATDKELWQKQAHLEAELIETKGDAAVLIGDDLRIKHATSAFLHMLGRKADELVGLKIESFIENCSPLTFGECLNQSAKAMPVRAVVRLRSKGHRSAVKEIKVYQRADFDENKSQYVLVFGDNPGFASANSPVRFRRQLIQATRQSLSQQERLDQIVNLVNYRVRGTDTITIVSIVTGLNSRKIVHQQKDSAFIADLSRHHDFKPSVSICATTVATNRYMFSSDTVTEERWPDYAWLFYTHGIRSVWCMPVPSDEGLTPGLITVFRKEAGGPDANDLETLEESAEWVSTLLFDEDALSNASHSYSATLCDLERRVNRAYQVAQDSDKFFLVSLNASELLERGVTESYIQELVSLHFGNPGSVFKMRHNLWCWIVTSSDSPVVQGAVEKMNSAISSWDSSGHYLPTSTTPMCAFREVTNGSNLAAAVAALGREIIGQQLYC